MGDDLELAERQSWIGRTRVAADFVTPRLLRSFEATLNPHLATVQSGAPPGFHWCLAPDIFENAKLGHDGHPAKGEFLPPIPLPRRMWAGGTLAFHSEIREGDSIGRRSAITAIEEKQGRTGPLCFVTVRHEVKTLRGIAIEESQSLVYRPHESAESDSNSDEKLRSESARIGDHVREVSVDPIVLFRYSAVTFNGHRIHYDAPYATGTEHYSGLVVHGPLQATYLVNFATTIAGRVPARFSFRSLAPATGVKMIFLNARKFAGRAMELWVTNPSGQITMSGEASWRAISSPCCGAVRPWVRPG